MELALNRKPVILEQNLPLFLPNWCSVASDIPEVSALLAFLKNSEVGIVGYDHSAPAKGAENNGALKCSSRYRYLVEFKEPMMPLKSVEISIFVLVKEQSS